MGFYRFAAEINQHMGRVNLLAVKTFAFSLKAIELYKTLVYEKKEYVISKQFLKSATSIGANVEESIGGQSERDFFMKLNIAYKEARECYYWLRLMRESGLSDHQELPCLLEDCNEIQKILGSTIKTLRVKLTKK